MKFTPEQRAGIITDLNNGVKVKTIATKYGATKAYVYRLKSTTQQKAANKFKTKTMLRKASTEKSIANLKTNKSLNFTWVTPPNEIDVLRAENEFLKTKVEYLTSR